jgi:hypothetical protein
MSVDRPPIPTADRKPAWRGACLAYREKRREGASNHEAHEAAVAAVQAVWSLPWKEASAETVNAVAYASRYHSEWGYGAVCRRKAVCSPFVRWRDAVSSSLLERVEVIRESAARLEEKLFQYAKDMPNDNPSLYGDAMAELCELREKIEELTRLLRKYFPNG